MLTVEATPMHWEGITKAVPIETCSRYSVTKKEPIGNLKRPSSKGVGYQLEISPLWRGTIGCLVFRLMLVLT